jgi:hypothetical protein
MGSGGITPSFLTSALDGESGQLQVLTYFTHDKIAVLIGQDDR